MAMVEEVEVAEAVANLALADTLGVEVIIQAVVDKAQVVEEEVAEALVQVVKAVVDYRKR